MYHLLHHPEAAGLTEDWHGCEGTEEVPTQRHYSVRMEYLPQECTERILCDSVTKQDEYRNQVVEIGMVWFIFTPDDPLKGLVLSVITICALKG